MASAPGNEFVDLSGIKAPQSGNPYHALIEASHNHAKEVQERYEAHRTTRTAQQKAKLTASDFQGVSIDQILRRLENPDVEPGYVDPRHCLVFWARPPPKVKSLINKIQQELRTVAPNLWLMPLENLHMTALEMTHSKTEEQIAALIEKMKPSIPEITNFTMKHQARVVKPMVSYDHQAIALSYVPAAGDVVNPFRPLEEDEYTYHHLRRDLYDLCQGTGVDVDSRYVVPSSHLTIGRFITSKDTSKEPFDEANPTPDPDKMKLLIQKIEEINTWLEKQYWGSDRHQTLAGGGEWIVGETKGLDNRFGTLWYGGGTTIRLGEGFPSYNYDEMKL